LIANEQFTASLKTFQEDQKYIPKSNEFLFLGHVVVNTLCREFNVFVPHNMLMQKISNISYQMKLRLRVAYLKYKTQSVISLVYWDKFIKFRKERYQK